MSNSTYYFKYNEKEIKRSSFFNSTMSGDVSSEINYCQLTVKRPLDAYGR